MIVRANSLVQLPLDHSTVQCCVTSPPYWGLRDYGVDGQLGLESTPEEYVERLVSVFREVRRVLRDDGTVWLNLGDSYAGQHVRYEGKEKKWQHGVSKTRKSEKPLGAAAGIKAKQLIGIPWRVAFALQADGWYLRSDIIWSKPNPMPESVTDRPTKAHEYLFLISKSQKYYYDADAIKEQAIDLPGTHRGGALIRAAKGGGIDDTGKVSWEHHGGGINSLLSTGMRNRRTVWNIATQPSPEAHFAAFPEALVEPCVLAGSSAGDLVLDPFGGTGTTVKVAQRLGRKGLALELSVKYCRMAMEKTWQTTRQGHLT